MVITLAPQLEAVLSEQARRRGITPEVLALDALRAHFLPHLAPWSRATNGSGGCLEWRRIAAYP
jgi:hypothetical protein